MKNIFSKALLLASLASSPVIAQEDEGIVFGLPVYAPEAIADSLDLLVSRLDASLDKRVEIERGLNDEEILNLVKSGRLDGAIVGSSYMSQVSPDIEVFSLPFIYENLGSIEDFVFSESGRQAFESLPVEGVSALSFWPGDRNVLVSSTPILNAQALQGLKVRTVPSKGNAVAYEALGSRPVSIPYSEVYSALQTGVVDAVETGWESSIAAKLSEIYPYATDIGYGAGGYVVIINEDFLGGLSEDEAGKLWDSVSAATNFAFRVQENRAEQSRQSLHNAGFSTSQLYSDGASVSDDVLTGWENIGLNSKLIAAAAGTRGGGDYCSIDECRCLNRTCSEDCCPNDS